MHDVSKKITVGSLVQYKIVPGLNRLGVVFGIISFDGSEPKRFVIFWNDRSWNKHIKDNIFFDYELKKIC